MGKNWRPYNWNKLIQIFIMMVSIMSCVSKNKEIKAFYPLSDLSDVFDPSRLEIIHYYYVVDNIAGKLLYVNHLNDYEFILAEKIVQDSDTEYSVYLKDNAVFSNGEKITSLDVVRSFKRLLLRGSVHVPLDEIIEGGEKIRSLDDNVSGLYVVNDRSFKIRLKKKIKNLYYYLSMADMCVIHKSVAEKEIIKKDDWNIVSGAYFYKDNKLIANKKFINYHNDMPSVVHLFSTPQSGTAQDLEGYDIGSTAFINKETGGFERLSPKFVLNSDNYNYLVYVYLNPESKLFENKNTRQRIFKKLQESFNTPKNNRFFKKATQYFLPDVAGVKADYSYLNVLNSSKEIEIPNFSIATTVGTKKYTFESLEEEISKSLGSTVKVNFTDSMDQYAEKKKNRQFDAYMIPTSMNYNSPSEAMNHLYFKENNIVKTNSKKIKELILDLQSQEIKPGAFDAILDEMAQDATVIPLFYVSSPKFYNQEIVDASLMNMTESMVFWRLRVK